MPVLAKNVALRRRADFSFPFGAAQLSVLTTVVALRRRATSLMAVEGIATDSDQVA